MFYVSPSSGVPIFRQIVDQVHELIAAGAIAGGDMLPSTRQLAAALQVNMMTVSKAYQTLATEGVLENVRGRGMRCTKSNPESATHRKAEFAALAKPILHRGQTLGLTPQQMKSVLDRLIKQISR